METLLKELASKINIELNENQISNFFKYKDVLLETNKYINLTAITEERDIILKHFIDSLTINKYITQNSSLIDVGTGAGFPGIPIKIIREDVNVVLIDSLNKRINFLNNVIEELNLKNIKAVHSRAEDAALAELCLPFLKVNGIFICMKGNSVEEIENAEKAISILGGKIISVEKFVLPDSNIERNIILIKKIKETPSKYPRKAGLPSKQPIQ